MDALSRSLSSLSVSSRCAPSCSVYLLHLSLSPPGGDSLMVACSDFSLRLHHRPTLRLTQTLGGHSAPVSGLSTARTQPHAFYSASLDGSVRLWDVRAVGQTRQAQQEFRGAPEHAFSALGVSCDGALLCGGTEQVDGEDSFLVFWDARKPGAMLGVYSESHSDDITQVLFHPTDKDRMASGSTDGLVNVFDLSRGAEEEALIATCNSESSVSSLCWLGPGPAGGPAAGGPAAGGPAAGGAAAAGGPAAGGPAAGGAAAAGGPSHSRLLCVAHDEGLKLWDLLSLETEEQLTVYSSRDARCSSADSAVDSSVDFLVGGLWLEQEQQVLVLGGRAGGEVLLFSCDAQGLRLLRRLKSGHSAPVRCFGFDPQSHDVGRDSHRSLKSSSVMRLKSRPHNKHKLNRRTKPT
ncbi:unnamed protein product [Knipowitschia caucasica]